jgi:hypothetical protein
MHADNVVSGIAECKLHVHCAFSTQEAATADRCGYHTRWLRNIFPSKTIALHLMLIWIFKSVLRLALNL